MFVLKEKCLEIIIENFDRYYLAYSATEDLSEKIKYEYLRRKYSFKIAQSLHEKNSLRIEHIDFVINKYLKSLDTYWLQSFPWDVISKKLKEIGPSLEEVYFNDADHLWEEIICHLPNLLSVSFSVCNDFYLELIAKFCPKIESIDCTSSAFTKDGFKHICCQENGKYPCPELKKIVVGSPHHYFQKITDGDIGYLIKNLPSLEKIEHPNLPGILYSIHKDDINVLDKVKPYNLTDIQLVELVYAHSPRFDDMLKICVSLCPNLICFSCSVGKEEHLNLCSQLLKIQKLNLLNFRDPPVCLNSFLTLKGSLLTSLHISNFSLSVSCVLQNCRNLITLHMDLINFISDESGNDSTLPCLKDLTFENLISIDHVTVKAVTSLLSSSSNIESLCFKNVELVFLDIQAAIMKCCEHNKLQNIDFRGSIIDIKFAQDILLTCSSLSTLNLEYSDDYEEIEMLGNIAETLPNRPYIQYSDGQNSDDFSDYDDFVNEYDDFLDTDDDDNDYGYSDEVDSDGPYDILDMI